MLCFRCEHRANFLEKGHGPRYECQQATMSVSCCYMFKPCYPIHLEKSDKEDPRPFPASGIFASRSRAMGLIKDNLTLKAIKYKSGVFLTWDKEPT